MIKVGSDFSGVGAFNQALNRLGIDYEEIFACDMDKYARQTFIHNYGKPKYYPADVYEREIPAESLDIYMTSPPCQAFSLAGKRLGKEDKRGILFFNSLEFIEINKPRYFIFENVKGLLSDDGGKTFSEWVNLLGGKSVNGNPILFPYEGTVPYHLYWQVLNAKEHGVPQNRERVFLIGIRDDQDNNFRFPAEEPLTKRLKDVLEDEVDKKYFLSEKMIDCLENYKSDKFQINTPFINETNMARTINSRVHMMGRQDNYLKIGTWRTHEDGKGFREVEDGNCPTIPARAREDGSGQPVIKVKSATSKGYEEVTEGDSINFSVPSSETRRGRVGKQVAQTIETQANQGVILQYGNKRLNETLSKNQLKDEPAVIDCYNQKVNPISHTIDTRVNAANMTQLWDGYKIRRLTPRECFRLMDFPDSFDFSIVSDSQAYKQAGNSIVVNVLYKIIKNLKL